MKEGPSSHLDPNRDVIAPLEVEQVAREEFGHPKDKPVEKQEEPKKPKRHGKRRKEMNVTERSFAEILEEKKKAGKIVGFEYESTTLRWGTMDNVQYTPDFTVIEESLKVSGSEYPLQRIVYVEVKGDHFWPQAIQKFKQARNQFPNFEFQFWQKQSKKDGGEWKRLL